jgi:ubiquinone biosynthesis protein UbiJ
VAVNRYLSQDPNALEQCGKLSGKVLALVLDGLDWAFYLEFHAGGVRVWSQWPEKATVTVRGTPVLLARVGFEMLQDGGLPEGLQIEGDAAFLQKVQKLFQQVGFDLAAFLEPSLGPANAFRAASGLQQLFQIGKRGFAKLVQDGSEYLREESRDVARKGDVEAWMDKVDTLRDRTARLEQRLKRLEGA